MTGSPSVKELGTDARDTTADAPEGTPKKQGATEDLAPPSAPPVAPTEVSAPPPPELTKSLRDNVGEKLGLVLDSLEPEAYATFRSLRGKSHQITHVGAENLMIKQPDGSMKAVPNPKSGLKSEFNEGYLVTANPVEIAALCQNEAFDVEYTIDPEDPTGYWEALGIVEMEEVTVRTRKHQKSGAEAAAIVTGAMTSANTQR